jgi:alpha-L-fucosidase
VSLQWYRDAKLGIRISWGPASVAAFAPWERGAEHDVLRESGWEELIANYPDSRWYRNSLRLGQRATVDHHRVKFHPKTGYHRLAQRFDADLHRWEVGAWADLFREIGSRYVIMSAKGPDGYLLWPSTTPPSEHSHVASRDVVGELAAAVRTAGLRYGVAYSGLPDWTVQSEPIASFADLVGAGLSTQLAAYVDAHYRELIQRYRPDLLWNEYWIPAHLSVRHLKRHYRSLVPDGALANCWCRVGDETKARRHLLAARPVRRGADIPVIVAAPPSGKIGRPWELVCGLGISPAFNEAEPEVSTYTGEQLVHLLIDVVSKNGNLLVTLAPGPNGAFRRPHVRVLMDLAKWLRDNGEAIYGTRPWHVPEGSTSDGIPVRFTARDDALYCIVCGRPRMLSLTIRPVDRSRIPKRRVRGRKPVVSILGSERAIEWQLAAGSLTVDLPGSFIAGAATVVRIGWNHGRVDGPRPDRFYTDVI